MWSVHNAMMLSTLVLLIGTITCLQEGSLVVILIRGFVLSILLMILGMFLIFSAGRFG